MNSRTYFAPLRVCGRNIFLVSLVLVSSVAVHSQLSEQTLKPPREGLMALYWPNLSDLEESVREQIKEQQNALIVVARNPATSTTELSEAFGKLGQLYHAYSLVSSARDCYFNANFLAPNDFRWIYLAADLDRQTGRSEDGIRRYRLVRTLRPDYIAAPVSLGNMFLRMNRLDEARASFLAALEIDKNDPAAHYGLGEIALSERNYSEAIQQFNQTLAQVPSANRVHYSLAMAYRGLGDLEKVKAHLAQQVRLACECPIRLLMVFRIWLKASACILRVESRRSKRASTRKRLMNIAKRSRQTLTVSRLASTSEQRCHSLVTRKVRRSSLKKLSALSPGESTRITTSQFS